MWLTSFPARLVGNGVALLQTGLTFPQSVGPVLGSLLLFAPFIGADGAYFIMAGILVVTILSLYLMPPGSPRNVPRGSVTRELLLGLRYAWRQPRLRVLLATLLLVSATAGPYQNVLPGLLENVFGIESRNLGLVTWPMGVGSFIVGLSVAGVVGTRWSAGVLLVMSCAFGLGVALLGVTPNALVMLPVVFLIGSGFSAFQTLNTAEVIRQSEREYHGRVTALTFLPFGVQSFTGLGFGQVADMIGEQDVLIIMGLSSIAISLILGTIYLRMKPPTIQVHEAASASDPANASACGCGDAAAEVAILSLVVQWTPLCLRHLPPRSGGRKELLDGCRGSPRQGSQSGYR